ncbi:MAG: hypothetical protein WCK32_00110 [Chlorobiaceae bacterium]
MFINPLEILGISNVTEAKGINNESVKKLKRKLFADIDLSDDGVYDYYGLKITKGSCEKVIDELNNDNYKEFYLYLASNNPLTEFLVTGKGSIFINFKLDSIFKCPEFISFISPYFSPKFDQALLLAFQDVDTEKIKAILNTTILISPSDINTAFKSTSIDIQNKISAIDKITQNIKNKASDYNEDNIVNIVSIVKKFYFPVEALNCLPQYFQSQILNVANAINYLSNSIWDSFYTTQVPQDLTGYLLQLNIEGVNRPTFESNYKFFKKNNDERIEQAKNATVLKKWGGFLLHINNIIAKVENETTQSSDAYIFLCNLFQVSELNALPSFANEIRDQIGHSIRSLSISMWNKQNDIKNSLATISIALKINIDNDIKNRFLEDQNDLIEIEKKYKGILICHFCNKNKPDENSKISKTLYKETHRSFFPRRVEFSYVNVDIPRCKKCKEIHLNLNNKYPIFLVGGTIFGGLFGSIFDSHFIIGGLIGVGISFFIAIKYENSQLNKKNIKSTSKSSLSKHPILAKKIEEGWTFSKPTA